MLLVRLADGTVFVGLLHDEERLFLDALIGDEALAVEAALEQGKVAGGRTEVHEDPWGGSA